MAVRPPRHARSTFPPAPPATSRIPAPAAADVLSAAGEGVDAFIAAAPHQALPQGRWWPMRIIGDAMAPTLERDDVALVVPCHAYEGHAVYVFADDAMYRAESGWLMVDNPRYWREPSNRKIEKFDADWFDATVIGRVVAVVKPFR